MSDLRIVIALDQPLLQLLQGVVSTKQQQQLDRIEQKVDRLIMNDTELRALLTKVDATTTHIAGSFQLLSDTTQTISNEMDTLIAQGQAAGTISPEAAAQLQQLADRAQTVSDASDPLVAALQAVAAKGAPVVPEPPPTPTV